MFAADIPEPIEEDSFTLTGAERLADQISEHWHAQGFRIRVWVERSAMPVTSTARRVQDRRQWVVRSDLKNGLPRPANPIVDLIIDLCRGQKVFDQERSIEKAHQLELISDDERQILCGLYTLKSGDGAAL